MMRLLALFCSFLASSTSAQAVCSIVTYGAVGDGVTLNTAAIRAAVAACAGGGRVLVPFSSPASSSNTSSSFLTGSFELAFDNLELHVEAGASLLGSTREVDYPLIPALPSYGTGRDVDSSLRFRPLVFASNVSNVSLTGGGVVDGQGETWWLKHFARRLRWSRPRLVEGMYCDGLLIEDLTFRNSPFWTLHPYASAAVTVRRVTVTAPGWAPNTDGVDPDSCSGVLIQDCVFRCGDDGVAIKSGLNAYGRAFARPCENVRVENVTVEPEFDNGSTNGVSIGSEMSGGVRNVTVDGLTVRRCAVGVYIKSMQGRGGAVEDVAFRNVRTERVLEPIRFAMDYTYRRRLSRRRSQRRGRSLQSRRGQGEEEEADEDEEGEDKERRDGEEEDGDDDGEGTPVFRNISVVNLTAVGAVVPGTFAGLEASPITGLLLQDVTIACGAQPNSSSSSSSNNNIRKLNFNANPLSSEERQQEQQQQEEESGTLPCQFRCKYANGSAVRTQPEACF